MTYDKKKTPVYDPEEGYNAYAAHYDEDIGFLDSFEKGYFTRIRHFFEGKKILDAGAGTGRNTIRFVDFGADVTAVDIAEEMLKVLKKKKPVVETICADVADMPFDDGVFDIIVSNLVLVHFKKPEVALEEFYRVLKDGGDLYLTVIHQKKQALLKTKDDAFKIESYYHNADKIREILEEYAFQILDETGIVENGTKISTIFRCRK